jgi:hypothetical protein
LNIKIKIVGLFGDKVDSRKGNSPSLIIKVSNISQWKR